LQHLGRARILRQSLDDGSRCCLLAEETIWIADLEEPHLWQWQRLCPQTLHVCLQVGEAQMLLLFSLLLLEDMFVLFVGK
jgi:hypothetical protein